MFLSKLSLDLLLNSVLLFRYPRSVQVVKIDI
jgi:hypothetical protein